MLALVQYVVLMLSVAFPIIRLRAHVSMDTWVMLSFTVYQSRIQPQNRAIQTLVELITFAMYMETMLRYVILVLDQIRIIIHNVAQNVCPTRIVHSTRPVYVTNVKIHVRVFVEVSLMIIACLRIFLVFRIHK